MMIVHMQLQSFSKLDQDQQKPATHRIDYGIDIETTMKQLENILENSTRKSRKVKPWSSTYFMDREVLRRNPQALIQKAAAGPDGKERKVRSERSCYVCMKRGNLGTEVFLCSQCRTIVYCSKKCQKKHWPSHKANCVKQRGVREATAPMMGFPIDADGKPIFWEEMIEKSKTMNKPV